MNFIELRNKGYQFLSGDGIEIGAFENPAVLPAVCNVKYCDVISTEEARNLFKEVDASELKEVDHIIDLNATGLANFKDNSLDFVVINHVMEHLVNPINVIKELHRVLKNKGKLSIAIPDKHYTFDIKRPLTEFPELVESYTSNKKDSDVYDYYDIIRYQYPQLLDVPEDELMMHLKGFKDRREHLNIWDSDTFKDFILKTLGLLEIKMYPLYEVHANQNQIEYFGIWEKELQMVSSDNILPNSTLSSSQHTLKHRIDFVDLRADFICLKGWGFIEGVNEQINTFICFQDSENTYLFKANQVLRNDVAEVFKNPIQNIGFEFAINKEQLSIPAGLYNIGVYTTSVNNQFSGFVKTEHQFSI